MALRKGIFYDSATNTLYLSTDGEDRIILGPNGEFQFSGITSGGTDPYVITIDNGGILHYEAVESFYCC